MSKTYKLSRNDTENSDFNSKKTFFLSDIYNKNKDNLDKLSIFFNELKKKYKLKDKEILDLIKKKDKLILIPISIFKNKLSPLEAITQYLKENLHFNFHKIALLLNRNDRTIWLTYFNAKKKKIRLIIKDNHYIPLSVLANRKLSILENLSYYLKEEGLTLKKVSELTGKDPRTIGTCYRRAIKKLGGGVK